MDSINELVERMKDKDAKAACNAMHILEDKSTRSKDVYKFMDEFIKMIEDKNSYIRNRGFALISANARWDTANKINDMLLKPLGINNANISKYADSMRPLIARDIEITLRKMS